MNIIINIQKQYVYAFLGNSKVDATINLQLWLDK